MKKVGLLTYFGDLNTGTNLQALATYKTIQSLSSDFKVELVNIKTFKQINRPYIKFMSIQSLLQDLKRLRKNQRFVKKNFILSSEKAKYISNYEKGEEYLTGLNYDIIVVGADTLLELHRVKSDEITIFWLSPAINGKKLMVASSAHNTTVNTISKLQKALIKKTVKTFDKISVRDHSTQRLIFDCCDGEIETIPIVPDPTFALKIDYSYVEKYLKKRSLSIPQNTICLHFSRNDHWIDELASILHRRHYKIASFRPHRFVDILLNDMSPLEQLGIYRYFTLTITNRFHDTIFCIKNNTPFLTYPFDSSYITKNGESKYQTLIKNFDLIDTNFFIVDKGFDVRSLAGKIDIAINAFWAKEAMISRKTKDLNDSYVNFLKSAMNENHIV